MSGNRKRTLSGSTEIYADIVDLPSSDNAVRINGNKGTVGQVLKKNDTSNKIEWGDEQSITASLPITISSNVVGFNTSSGTNKVAITTETGKRVLELGNNGGTHYIKLQENNGLILCSLLDVKGNINVLSGGELKFYSDAGGSTHFLDISKSHFRPTANMTSYEIGNGSFPINTITSRAFTSINTSIFSSGIKQASSGATFSITSLGTGDFTALNVSGNINANGNIVGDNATDISNIDSIGCASLTASGNITANGNFIGDGATDISGIANATITNLTATDEINLVDTGSFINMNGGDITHLTDISYNNVASTFAGGSASNKVVFTNCDLSSATNTQASATIPDTISGNKTFSGDVIFQGNIELGNTDSDIIEQIGIYKDFKTYSATKHFTENIDHQKKYFGESVSNVYTYKTNILNQTHFAPYGSARLSQSNTKSGGFPYRSKKLFPTDFQSNDDGGVSGSFPSIVDSGSYGTSGFSNNGGIKINNSGLELWTYFDVPEGMSLESVYLRVFDGSGNRLARNVKVFKKPMGLLGGDQRFQIKLIDANTITAGAIAVDWLGNEVGSGLSTPLGEVFYEQDCINEYDSCMAVRVALTSTSDVLMGGYALFRPNENLDYSIVVSTGSGAGSSFVSNFVINFNGINGVVSHTFTGSGQSTTITIPYDYAMSRNSSQGSVLQVVGDSGRSYAFTSLKNGSFDSVFERLDTPTTSASFSAPSGTMNTHLIKYRQEMSFTINQS